MSAFLERKGGSSQDIRRQITVAIEFHLIIKRNITNEQESAKICDA